MAVPILMQMVEPLFSCHGFNCWPRSGGPSQVEEEQSKFRDIPPEISPDFGSERNRSQRLLQGKLHRQASDRAASRPSARTGWGLCKPCINLASTQGIGRGIRAISRLVTTLPELSAREGCESPNLAYTLPRRRQGPLVPARRGKGGATSERSPRTMKIVVPAVVSLALCPGRQAEPTISPTPWAFLVGSSTRCSGLASRRRKRKRSTTTATCRVSRTWTMAWRGRTLGGRNRRCHELVREDQISRVARMPRGQR